MIDVEDVRLQIWVGDCVSFVTAQRGKHFVCHKVQISYNSWFGFGLTFWLDDLMLLNRLTAYWQMTRPLPTARMTLGSGRSFALDNLLLASCAVVLLRWWSSYRISQAWSTKGWSGLAQLRALR